MGDPEYVKITITVEKEDGSKTVFEIPKSLEPKLIEKMSDTVTLDNLDPRKLTKPRSIEELAFFMTPYKDEETGMMYQVTEHTPNDGPFRRQIRWNG